MLGGKNKQTQQKPNAIQMIQTLLGQHQVLYQLENQILSEIRNIKNEINIPDYGEDINALLTEVRSLYGLVKGVSTDVKNGNENLNKILELLDKDIKTTITSIDGHIAGMYSDFENSITMLNELVNQLNQTPEQLSEGLNTVLENFQEGLNSVLQEGITGKLDEIKLSVDNINEAFNNFKFEISGTLEEPITQIKNAVNELNELKESMPVEIGESIENTLNEKLQEFDQRITALEEKMDKMMKILEELYKLFYGR